MRASVHELHVTANELNMDLHVLIIFYQSFYLLWGEKKFKVLVYTGNNNLEYVSCELATEYRYMHVIYIHTI